MLQIDESTLKFYSMFNGWNVLAGTIDIGMLLMHMSSCRQATLPSVNSMTFTLHDRIETISVNDMFSFAKLDSKFESTLTHSRCADDAASFGCSELIVGMHSRKNCTRTTYPPCSHKNDKTCCHWSLSNSRALLSSANSSRHSAIRSAIKIFYTSYTFVIFV